MSRREEVFIPALKGKKIPIISLDNKWYRLMNGLDKTQSMQKLEDTLKDLLKRQGKLNTETKALKKQKKQLMDSIVGGMENNNIQKNEALKKQIEECNNKLLEYQDELLDLPGKIDKVNYDLMLETMQLCYETIQKNSENISEIADWITNIRIELKKNIVRKQQYELQNQNMYSYMHDIFGAEVIDIFDMTYDPGEKMLSSSSEGKKET